MSKHSFEIGFRQVRVCDVPEVRGKIMSALGIVSRASWAKRLYGRIVPNVDEAKEIEKIFAEYGIKSVWGRTTAKSEKA